MIIKYDNKIMLFERIFKFSSLKLNKGLNGRTPQWSLNSLISFFQITYGTYIRYVPKGKQQSSILFLFYSQKILLSFKNCCLIFGR